MLDIQDFSNGDIEKHPVSRCRYPGSFGTGNNFRHNDPDEIHELMQLWSLHKCNRYAGLDQFIFLYAHSTAHGIKTE